MNTMRLGLLPSRPSSLGTQHCHAACSASQEYPLLFSASPRSIVGLPTMQNPASSLGSVPRTCPLMRITMSPGSHPGAPATPVQMRWSSSWASTGT